nr:RIO1 family regulatory kinase/ATPase [Propionicimonas sp.]
MSDPSIRPVDWDTLTFHALNEELDVVQRWSTWGSVERSARGPQPWPGWLVTSAAALDTDLGVLKTGKEADVVLVERAVPDDPEQACLLAAKRYRDTDHRLFHRDAAYTEGRRIRNSRDGRAMSGKTAHGRAVAAGLWARSEWTALNQLFAAGVPVPYPVQLDGSEILMEFVGDGDAAAPRLQQVRPAPAQLAALFDQLLAALRAMTGLGIVHGDLSPFNTLVTGLDGTAPRLVVIDVPQVVDLVANPNAVEFLHRDCTNMAEWFSGRGLPVDADVLLADLLAHAW